MTQASLTKERLFYVLAVTLIFSFSSCRSLKKTTSSIETRRPVKKEIVKKERRIYTGMATYYADNYQGKPTASGELYDKNKYTTAVRLNTVPLPFGTMVEVLSVKRNKKVIVKVNDIMGNNSSSIIDLSYKAAKKIGLNIDGRTPVTIRVVEEGEN